MTSAIERLKEARDREHFAIVSKQIECALWTDHANRSEWGEWTAQWRTENFFLDPAFTGLYERVRTCLDCGALAETETRP